MALIGTCSFDSREGGVWSIVSL